MATRTMYGDANQTYVIDENVAYPADGNGRITGVLDAHVTQLIGQGCIDEAKWLALQREHPGAGTIVTVRISSAQLKNLFSTPILIVPAPGAGLAILPVTAVFVYLYGTIAYANVGLPDLYIGTSNSGPNWGQSSVLSSLFNLTQSEIAQAPINLNGSDPLNQIANTGIYLTDSQNWTNGNGTAIITVSYITVPTA